MKALSQYHSAVIAVCFLSVTAIAMLVPNPILQATALAGAMLFSATLFSSAKMLADLKFYIPMFLLVTLTNPLFSREGETVLFHIFEMPVALEAYLYGASVAATVTGVMLWADAALR